MLWLFLLIRDLCGHLQHVAGPQLRREQVAGQKEFLGKHSIFVSGEDVAQGFSKNGGRQKSPTLKKTI